jgi:hypothetical protein
MITCFSRSTRALTGGVTNVPGEGKHIAECSSGFRQTRDLGALARRRRLDLIGGRRPDPIEAGGERWLVRPEGEQQVAVVVDQHGSALALAPLAPAPTEGRDEQEDSQSKEASWSAGLDQEIKHDASLPYLGSGSGIAKGG